MGSKFRLFSLFYWIVSLSTRSFQNFRIIVKSNDYIQKVFRDCSLLFKLVWIRKNFWFSSRSGGSGNIFWAQLILVGTTNSYQFLFREDRPLLKDKTSEWTPVSSQTRPTASSTAANGGDWEMVEFVDLRWKWEPPEGNNEENWLNDNTYVMLRGHFINSIL